jgi:hypothetical protein
MLQQTRSFDTRIGHDQRARYVVLLAFLRKPFDRAGFDVYLRDVENAGHGGPSERCRMLRL